MRKVPTMPAITSTIASTYSTRLKVSLVCSSRATAIGSAIASMATTSSDAWPGPRTSRRPISSMPTESTLPMLKLPGSTASATL